MKHHKVLKRMDQQFSATVKHWTMFKMFQMSTSGQNLCP